jgi:hypothetical protein
MEWVVVTVFGAILTGSVGLGFWYLKKSLDKNEKARIEHECNMESLVLMMLQSERANTILCKATAEAVRDGHCNGNMTRAMQIVDQAAEEEKKFLLDKSIKYIFE